jgi:signal-transduction protein with cAMP-binding, CBS, and nucleotidyltransferase domain
MLADKIIHKDFKPLKPSDAASLALAKMDAWQVVSMPVVEPATGRVIGQIRLDELIDLKDESIPISSLELQTAPVAYQHQHVFEVARLMLLHEVRLIPVLTLEEQFLGIIEKKTVLETLSGMLNISASGSVITVELGKQDLTVSELVRLIENENATILGFTVQAPEKEDEFYTVSFKLSVNDTSAISSTLQRYGYTVMSDADSRILQLDISSRADELMRYLDV